MEEGFDLWAELERVVTPENVNRIPDDWNPDGMSSTARNYLAWVKQDEKDRGFLRFLCDGRMFFDGEDEIVVRFVRKWAPLIKWGNVEEQRDENGCSWFNWTQLTLYRSMRLALLFFQHGCPCPENYLERLSTFVSVTPQLGPPTDTKYELLTWLMDHNQLDLAWTKGPVWVNDFCETYKWRRARCQCIAIIVCGVAKRSPYFYGSRDVARLLAHHVWCTRRDAEWIHSLTPSQVKKL
jgi:hypothetical protein